MPRSSLRLPFGLRLWLWGALGGLFVTGVLWLTLQSGMHPENDPGTTGQVAQSWLLRLHGLAAFIALMVFGAVYVRHVKPAWQTKRNPGSGAMMVGGLGLLTFTGYGLYYFGGETLRVWTSYLHNGLGLALPALMVAHILRGRSQRPKISSPPLPKSPESHQNILQNPARE
jgi:hypothetical protein